MRRISFLFISTAIALGLTGCGIQAPSLSGATPTLYIITATLPPTAIPSITFTPVPPTVTPTTVPVAGLTSTQVNVRDKPATTGTLLGLLGPFGKVQVVGQTADNNWYEILYQDSPSGTGWVSSQYISIQQGKDQIPVIGGPDATATLPALGTGTPGASDGSVTQQVNVRKGPGTSFDTVGMLDANETVRLIGRDPSGGWLQIQYGAAPGGLGWISSQYVDSDAVETLPIIGQVDAGTPTPGGAPFVVQPTPGTAPQDNDSAQSPASSAVFTPGGTRALLYSSDLSSPQGDSSDYVAFMPAGGSVTMSLSCDGNGSVQTSLSTSGAAVAGWTGLGCGQTNAFNLAGGQNYTMEIRIVPVTVGASYVHYSLRIENSGS